ncbi:iron ABC transporter permease [Glycomyces luteolus]|uniref:Iron ABC transporter permease n=1 Tax=Glycomyces luteolus TaxID=2670330 RepID=A0A9X3P7S6_9ACTN|nr:iron ABC transporter permease [Glycomyces luteolus]MDA1359679.1 iron ABC transporter permease [Glycomyces luteolus]
MLDAHPTPDAVRPRTPARAAAVFAVGIAALAVCVALSLALGTRPVPLATVVEALFGDDASRDALAVTGIRLPRTVIGIVVGAALGLAGAVCQGVTRNPLASPTTLGVNAGAALAVVTAIHVLGLARPAEFLPFALAGAAIAAVAVFALARGAGDLDPVRLALSGTVLASVLAAWTSAVLLTSEQTLDEARFWLVGSLASRGLDMLAPVAVPLIAGTLLAFIVAPALNALSLGDEAASALGVPVGRTRILGGIAVVLLAASAVAVTGPIAFIGLAAPHLVRAVIGSDHRLLLPGCLIGGPVLLLAADVLGRMLLRPSEIEVGIVTAFLGAPLLAILARKATR